jgi:hypothetical protein
LISKIESQTIYAFSMNNKKRILPGVRLRRLRAQGFTTQNDQLLTDMAFGIRFAYRVCVIVLLVAISLKSTALFTSMLGIAFLGIVLPNHPFDYVYNYALKGLLNKPGIPMRPSQLKFACMIATAWLGAVVYLMTSGYKTAALSLAAILAAIALLPSTIDLCIPSTIYKVIFREKKQQNQIIQH